MHYIRHYSLTAWNEETTGQDTRWLALWYANNTGVSTGIGYHTLDVSWSVKHPYISRFGLFPYQGISRHWHVPYTKRVLSHKSHDFHTEPIFYLYIFPEISLFSRTFYIYIQVPKSIYIHRNSTCTSTEISLVLRIYIICLLISRNSILFKDQHSKFSLHLPFIYRQENPLCNF